MNVTEDRKRSSRCLAQSVSLSLVPHGQRRNASAKRRLAFVIRAHHPGRELFDRGTWHGVLYAIGRARAITRCGPPRHKREPDE